MRVSYLSQCPVRFRGVGGGWAYAQIRQVLCWSHTQNMDVYEDLESSLARYVSMCVLRRLCEYAISSQISCAGQLMTFLLSIIQKPPIIAHSVVPSRTRGLKFGLNLHIYSYFA